MTEDIREVEEREINTYRMRVHFLNQELWETSQQPNRINIMIQLADAVTSLLHLENNAWARSEAEQEEDTCTLYLSCCAKIKIQLGTTVSLTVSAEQLNCLTSLSANQFLMECSLNLIINPAAAISPSLENGAVVAPRPFFLRCYTKAEMHHR